MVIEEIARMSYETSRVLYVSEEIVGTLEGAVG